MSNPYLYLVVDIPRERWEYVVSGTRIRDVLWVRFVIDGRHVRIDYTHRPWLEKEQRRSKVKRNEAIAVSEATAQQWLEAAFGPEHGVTRRVIEEALPWAIAKRQERRDRIRKQVLG